MSVFVLDQKQRPLMPCREKRARKLLAAGRARIHRLYPFCIRIVDRALEDSVLQPLVIKIDPGSKVTGLAVCRVPEVVDVDGVIAPVMHIQFLMQLAHRGQAIKKSMLARSSMRRRRRGNLRYRQPRFDNRTREAVWLPPSLLHRVLTTESWVNRLRSMAPITQIAQELVRFDMQKMQNPEITGVEYQQGTLAGYELREYLLEKWSRECSYCGEKDVPLQMEHIVAKANGGSNRASNLCLGCEDCNQKKGAKDIRDFLKNDPIRLAHILKHAKVSLRDAAAVNATRNALLKALQATGLPVETGTGGRTKWNRSRLGLVKTHALDAACVGVVADVLGTNAPALQITCMGRGCHSRTLLDQYGFPRTRLPRTKTFFGFKTGDMIAADVAKGKKAGSYQGRVAVRSSGYFNIQSGIKGIKAVQGISHKDCRITQRADGYNYLWQSVSDQPKARASTAVQSAPYLTVLKNGVSRSII